MLRQPRSAGLASCVQRQGQALACKVGRGYGDVLHGTQRLDLAAAQGLPDGGDAAQHLPLTQPFMGAVLVVMNDLHGQPLLRQPGQCGQRPGGNAVGVDGYRDAFFFPCAAKRAGGQLLEIALQVSTQQAQHFGVFEQQLAR